MKKFLAVLLAALMVMSVPAFAAVEFSADAEWNVTAATDAENAQMILAVYDADKNLVDVKLGGTSATVAAADYVNSDHTLRYFVWDGVDKNLIPYDRSAIGAIALSATAYTNNVKLEWNHIGKAEDISYDVYCDGSKVAAVSGGAYMYGVAPGEHTYYVASGDAISNEVTISSLDWLDALIAAYPDDIAYAVAGAEEDTASLEDDDSDIEIGLSQKNWTGYNPHLLYPKAEAETVLGTELAASVTNAYFTTGTQDDGIMHVSKADANGVTKNAWFTTLHDRPNRPNKDVSNGFIYFVLDEVPAASAWYVAVEYLDTADVNFNLTYTTTQGETQTSTAGFTSSKETITGSDSGEWKVGYFALPSTNFTGSGMLGTECDFRINCNKKDTYISRVVILPQKTHDTVFGYNIPVTTAAYPDGVSVEVDENDEVISNGIIQEHGRTVNVGSDGTCVVENGYWVAYRTAGRTNIYFDVSDDYIYGRKDGYVEVDVTYLDNCEGAQIKLDYSCTDASGALGGAYAKSCPLTPKMTGDGTLKTHTFVLNDASFVNTQNPGDPAIGASKAIDLGGTDFRISLSGGDTTKYLTVKKVVVRNVNHKDVEKVTISE